MSGAGETVDYLEALTPHLWVFAIVFFGVGDLVTTGIGLRFERVIEVGPLAAVVLQSYGIETLVPLKLLTLALCYGLWRVTPAPHDVGVPLGLAALGVLVTLWNTYVLTTVV